MLYCFTDHVQTATRVAAYQRVLCTVALLYLTLISLMVNDLGWPSGSCSVASTVGALLWLEEVVRRVVRRVVTLLLLVVVLSRFDCSCVYDHGLASEVLNVLVRSWWRLAVITCHRRWAVRWLQLTFALQVFLKLRSAAEVLTCTLFYIFLSLSACLPYWPLCLLERFVDNIGIQ